MIQEEDEALYCKPHKHAWNAKIFFIFSGLQVSIGELCERLRSVKFKVRRLAAVDSSVNESLDQADEAIG